MARGETREVTQEHSADNTIFLEGMVVRGLRKRLDEDARNM